MKEQQSRIEQRRVDQQVGEALAGYKNAVRVFKASIGEEAPTDFSTVENIIENARNRYHRLALAQAAEFIAVEVSLNFWERKLSSI